VTKKISFIKMHGLGNDFVIINKQSLPTDLDVATLAINMSDRRLGVGADQFIVYDKSSEYVDMIIFNQDGSHAKACGNASRCLVKLMHDQYQLNKFILKIDDRLLNCEYLDGNLYAVNMGEVSFAASWMPGSSELLTLASKYNLGPKDVICADVGNPHIIIFSKLSEQDQKIIGKDLQKSPLFPDGINVNFANVNGDKIALRVFERGTGFTLACGSGACASYAGSKRLGHSGAQAEVHFKLGKLLMRMENNQVIMIGPATYAFQGEYLYD
jgi:diaminopimelate epimerase